MGEQDLPGWTTAATSAAVRLAAEAGREVDEILEHSGFDGTPLERLAQQIRRFEQSAELTEVATDLAGLLWAEDEDVPLIATILNEPLARASLEAIAEARRTAARRLAASSALSARRAAEAQATPDLAEPSADLVAAATTAPGDRAPAADAAEPESRFEAGDREVPVLAPDPNRTHEGAASRRPAGAASQPQRRPATGVILAGAAAAILLFGRRLRRA